MKWSAINGRKTMSVCSGCLDAIILLEFRDEFHVARIVKWLQKQFAKFNCFFFKMEKNQIWILFSRVRNIYLFILLFNGSRFSHSLSAVNNFFQICENINFFTYFFILIRLINSIRITERSWKMHKRKRGNIDSFTLYYNYDF